MTEKYLLRNGADVVTLTHSIEDSAERVTVHLNDRQLAAFSQSPLAAFPDNAELDEERGLLLKYVRGPEGNYFVLMEGDRRLVGFSRLQKSPRLIARIVLWYEGLGLVVLAMKVLFMVYFSGRKNVFAELKVLSGAEPR